MIQISENEEKLFSRVEKSIEKYYSVEINKIVSKNTTNIASSARNMLFYILHCDYGVSVGKIAQAYFRTVRGVYLQLSIIKFQINNEECSRILHERILREIS